MVNDDKNIKQDLPVLLTIRNAAARLSVSQSTIRAWIRDRRIPYVKLGKRVAIEEVTLESLISVGRRAALLLRARRNKERKGKKNSSAARPRQRRHRTPSSVGEKPGSNRGRHDETPKQGSGQI